MNCGALLIELRTDVGHGGFIKYCEEELGLNYKMCQRYMDVAQYRTQIEAIPAITDLQGALKIANKIKVDEKVERDAKEAVMFENYKDAEDIYAEELQSADDAKAAAEIVKPTPSWSTVKDSVERRNVSNRYKIWKKKIAEASKPPVDELPADAQSVSIDELVEAAYQVAMLKLDVLTGDELADAVALLIDRLTASDFPEM
jgi:glutamine synthetase type III